MDRKGKLKSSAVKYKYLTEEMRRVIDGEIKTVGQDELYKRVEHNIMAQRLAQLQNEEGAFNEIQNGPFRTTQWEYKFYNQYTQPIVLPGDSLESEMLHYILYSLPQKF